MHLKGLILQTFIVLKSLISFDFKKTNVLVSG